MQKVKSKLMINFIFIMSFFTLLSSTQTITVSAEGYGLDNISIRPIFTETQDELEDGFFSIISGSNQVSEDIKFEISNNSEESVNLDVRILNAYTSPSGVIQYEEEGTTDSLILDNNFEMKRYIEGPESVSIDAGGEKTVSFKLESPVVNGQVLGGIAFVPPTISDESSSFLQINNEIRVIYGILISGEGMSYKGFSLKKPYIEPMPSYYVVRYPIENNSNSLLIDISMNYVVEDMKSNKIFEGREAFSMAPKTIVHAEIPFNNDKIRVNTKYRIKGTVEFEFENEPVKLDFNETFKYKNKDSAITNAKSNKEIPLAKEVGVNFWIYVIIGLMVFIFIIIFLIKKNKDERENISKNND